ncbi:hypothetical protein NW762_011436 [Fusarium torreyae]|uniref:Uncharacterized protein n=1 Tax=Fusarium torreyae TaxID=1237075 RepID=A0A9W8VAJ5_9HYPO|nr:hypothetical protein NW762_011436 [Fusarium torreyae]
MSSDTDPLCGVCAAIDFEELFYPGLSGPERGFRGTDLEGLHPLEEILKRAENCYFCTLIIDAHKERDEAAPTSGTELHEEVKKYGLRLTLLDTATNCHSVRYNFALTNVDPIEGPDINRSVGVDRVKITLDPWPWTNLGIDEVKLQAIWPDGIPDTEKRTISGGYLSMEGTGRAMGHLLEFSMARN